MCVHIQLQIEKKMGDFVSSYCFLFLVIKSPILFYLFVCV
jgi:hypothetical protein